MGLPITERQANEMSGTDLFYTVVRRADEEYGDPYYVRLSSLMAFILGREVSGYVTGPVSSTNNAIARYSGVGGDVLRNSSVTISDAGVVTLGGLAMEGFFDWVEIAQPANPAANIGRMYAKDDGGVTKPYWLDPDGTESLMLGAGVTGVTAAAVIADHTLVRGADGARGVQDSGWVLGDDDVLQAGDNLDMNDKDIINIRDILPYDGELGIQLPSDGRVIVKGTFDTTWSANAGALAGFDADLKAVWHLERTVLGASEEDSKGSNDFDASNVTVGGGKRYGCGFWIRTGSQEMSQTPGSDLLPSDGFGLSLWINMASLPAVSDYYMILQSGGSGAGTNNILLRYYNIAGTSKLDFNIRESGGGLKTINEDYTLTLGTWFHVYILADGANIELWVNGAQIGASVAYDGTMRQNASDFILGAEDGSSQYLDARMDEIYWWNGTTAPSASDLYNGGTGAFYGSRSLASINVQDYIYASNSGLQLADLDASHYLNIKWNESEEVNSRVLSVVMGGANRSITYEGDAIVSQDYSEDATPRFGGLLLDGDINMEETTMLNVIFETNSDCTVYIKNTGAGEGFASEAIDDHDAFLVAYWKMEETGAADRVDSIGANDLTAINAPGNRAGINNFGCDFVNASSESLSLVDNADMSPTTGMALSFWAYSDVAGYESRLIEKRESYLFWRTGADDTYLAYVYQGDGTAKIISGLQITIGSWHHVVIIADSGYVRCYIDNVEQQAAVAYDNTIKDNAYTFYIGSQAGGGNFWDGGCDEVGFWKNISFADQTEREAFVSALYNGGVGRFWAVAGTGEANLDVADFLYLSNTGLQLADTDDSHNLNIKWNENEAAADRTLNVIMGGADRTLDMTTVIAAHVILDGAVHTDSVADGVTRGSLIYGNSTPKWDELVVGTGFVGGDGTDVRYRSYANVLVDLSGQAGAAFAWNGQDLSGIGAIGCATIIATGAVTVDDLLLYDTNASHTMTLHWNEDEAGANRILNFVLGGADRTITLSGNPTLDDWFDQGVKQASNVNFGTIGCGEITAGADTDIACIFGRTRIDSGNSNDYAWFSHYDKTALTDYALRQGPTGITYLNSVAGQDIFFRIGNSTKMRLDELGGLTLETAIGDATPVANTLYKDSIIKAWVKYETSGAASIEDSFNVSGLTDHAVGDTTISWDVDFANTTYAVTLISNQVSAGISTMAVGSQRFRTYTAAGALADVVRACATAIGDQ